jgi:hypothetical protein
VVRELGSRSYILQKGVQTESRDRCRGQSKLPHFVRLKRAVAVGDRSAGGGDQQVAGVSVAPLVSAILPTTLGQWDAVSVNWWLYRPAREPPLPPTLKYLLRTAQLDARRTPEGESLTQAASP